MKLTVTRDTTGDLVQAAATLIETHLPRAAELLETAVVELSVAIVDDATMARLHEDFLGIAGPTDVLTFELEHTAGGDVSEGEVVICAGEAQRQAIGRGHDASVELLLYAVHGLLHLCGYDDLEPEAYRKMHAKEDELLEKLGFGCVFDLKSHSEAEG